MNAFSCSADSFWPKLRVKRLVPGEMGLKGERTEQGEGNWWEDSRRRRRNWSSLLKGALLAFSSGQDMVKGGAFNLIFLHR